MTLSVQYSGHNSQFQLNFFFSANIQFYYNFMVRMLIYAILNLNPLNCCCACVRKRWKIRKEKHNCFSWWMIVFVSTVTIVGEGRRTKEDVYDKYRVAKRHEKLTRTFANSRMTSVLTIHLYMYIQMDRHTVFVIKYKFSTLFFFGAENVPTDVCVCGHALVLGVRMSESHIRSVYHAI